jgi:type II secretory pathway pseudopilin PulG
MRLRKKNSSFLSPSDKVGLQRNERGYALVILMMIATLMLVALTAALPSIYQEGQREREDELLFRGNEYARAIALFYRQFRRYPVSVNELLSTNGFRFLRRPYTDPMTRGGKWRFIHAGPNGAILDSRTMGSNSPEAGAGKQTDSSSTFSTTKPSQSAFFGDGNETRGVSIVGVASPSKKESIRVWNGHTRYDDWEFLGTTFTPYTAPQLSTPAGQSSPGSPSSTQPFSSGPTSPTTPFPSR